MTDSSMNFGPAWIRNLRPEGTTTSAGGGTGGGSRYQLAEYRYGREEMLALFDKMVKPPPSMVTFKTLYSEQTLVPLALLPNTEEEQRGWQTRPTAIGGAPRGRGGSLERGGRISRGRGGYQAYGRAASAYDSGWGNGEQLDWSPRKEFTRPGVSDNWRRVRSNEDDDGWRNINSSRSLHEKWGRSASWRGEGDSEERNGPPERGGRPSWHENSRGGPLRRSWDNEDHLPEWATENPTEGGGTFDERGAFHGSDDEQDIRKDRKDMLQKSTSQQHIPRTSQIGLSSSKSTTSLAKSEDSDKYLEEPIEQGSREDVVKLKESSSPEKEKSKTSLYQIIDKRVDSKDDKCEEAKPQSLEKPSNSNGPPQEPMTPNIDKVDEDFDRLQEDLVLKLVVDEETPKSAQSSSNFDVGGVQPPPNLVPPSQEKWYYQDPQGTRQGPFANVEMAEWYKAGYFSNQLNVMRECDERYFLLGELINLCGGENPFLSNMRFPVLKNEPAKLPDDMLPYQFLSQLAFKQQVSLRNLAEPWSALTLQQQEMAAQRLLMQQQQQQIPPDLQFMQQSTPSNPLMYMINQMQQSNKLPGSVLVEKPNSSVPNQLDPLLVQMGNMHSLQNRMQNPGLHNHLPGGVPANLPSSLPPEGLGGNMPTMQSPPIVPGGISSLPGIRNSLPGALPSVNVNRPTSHGSIDQLQPNQENDPITNFLKQFQQQRQIPVNSVWQEQNQFNVAPPVSTPTQWPQQSETPLSMWDLQSKATPLPSEIPTAPTDKIIQQQEQEKERPKEEVSQKELKKRKDQEDKQAKKEAEERRKQEQKKQEAEKKAAEEKKKKEEEKVRKELERAKKEAEEKRLRELEEKRRLKEQRKAEEEARKKSEELKKVEDEKTRREVKEREEKKQAEAVRLAQSQAARGASKSAPWSQSNFTAGVNLTDIQKAEKEKRAQETAIQLQKQQLQEQQQQQLEKNSGLQLNWAKKPIEQRKVKSFAEIQAEEQERMAKLSAEAKLAAQLKEKEAPVSNAAGNIWNGQSLTWANASSTSQWSSNSAGGFWDEIPSKSSNKPSTVSKSNSTSAMTTAKQQQQKQSKNKTKKEESLKSVNNNNNQTKDEFTDWCYKTLANISADVDIPTFVTFLRDIESAYDVRDYCKEYLGESPATQQFASNFLEKRRSCKPKNNAHKDDMCSPAPAITPSSQHSTEFQEVKGKNKKNKKSKMLKVDSRILGFNVTSAPDRINVGDRDYGDNS